MRPLLLLALVLGCSRPRPQAQPVPAAETTVAHVEVDASAVIAVVDASVPAAERVDDAAAKARRCAVAQADVAARKQALAGFTGPTAIARVPFGTCWSGPAATWALSVDLEDGAVKSLAVIHVDAGEHPTRRSIPLEDIAGSARTFVEAQVFDFDDDGDPELYLAFDGEGAGCDAVHFPFGVLLGEKAGKVVPYAPAKGLFLLGMKDVDGDGRPDLLSSAPFDKEDAELGPVPRFTPRLVAHSVPDGTFSRNDAVAVAAARKICPKKPTKGATPWGPDTPKIVGCARLWGLSEAEIFALQPDGRSEMDDLAANEFVRPFLTAKMPLTLR